MHGQPFVTGGQNVHLELLTEGRSRNCDLKCKLGTYFCGFGLYSCNVILHAMCFQFCLHRDIHKKCIPILI